MAWYEINYACGHSGREQLYGKTDSRESYVEWAEQNKICPECWAKKKEEERLAKIEALRFITILGDITPVCPPGNT